MARRNQVVFSGTLTIAAGNATGFLAIGDIAKAGDEGEAYLCSVRNGHASQTISEIYFQNVIPFAAGDTDITVTKLTGLTIGVPATDAAAGTIDSWVNQGWPMGKSSKIGFKRSSTSGTMDIQVEIRRA